MLFNKNWFEENQGNLLWLLNTPLIKTWFRWVLCINGKRSSVGGNKITKILPNVIFWKGKNRRVVAEFRTHNKFSKRLFYAFKPIWYLFHTWDVFIANEFAPKFNLGFDSFTFFPATGANSPVDGHVRLENVNETFSTLRNTADGNIAQVSNVADTVGHLRASVTTDQYQRLDRGFFLFDTSLLTDGTIILSAIFSLYGTNKDNGLGDTTLDIVSSNPANTNNLVTGDYDTLSTTVFSDISSASFSTSGYNDFTLDSNGRDNISDTGVSKFGARLGWDTDNSFGGSWVLGDITQFTCSMADEAGTSQDPKLVVSAIVSPSVTTNDVTDIDFNSVTGNGNATGDGGGTISERGFVVSLDPNPTLDDTKFIVAGTTGAYSTSLTGLTEGTIYHVRAYVTNEITTSFGDDIEFTTLFLPVGDPTIKNTRIERITKTSAVLVANFVDARGKTITEKGIVFGETISPVIETDTKVVAPNIDTGEYSTKMTGLTANTFYYARGYVTTAEDGTFYA